tara:strand:- start:28343 stop:29425 length:1083 start_codon:yes stop_codon:yes gene_type:complete
MMLRKIIAAALGALVMCASAPATAGVQYVYDSSGRLIKATYSNGVTIEYRYDAAGNRTQILSVSAPNSPPVAVNDAASVGYSSAVDIQVRANDSDPDGNTLTVTGVGVPTGGGSAAIQGGGTYVRYTAPATAGVRTFTYTISDGAGATATATVSVSVTGPPNQPPVAVGDSASVVANNVVDISVLANDSDPDGNALTVTGVGTPTGGGSVAIQGGGTHVRYTAPATPGAKTFTYTISDGAGGSATATVTVTVTAPSNQTPVAQNDYGFVTANHAIALMVLANDTDPNGDTLTVVSVTNITGGSVSIAPGGSYVTYFAGSTAGSESFDYTISDGHGGNATGHVEVEVGCDNSGNQQCDEPG